MGERAETKSVARQEHLPQKSVRKRQLLRSHWMMRKQNETGENKEQGGQKVGLRSTVCLVPNSSDHTYPRMSMPRTQCNYRQEREATRMESKRWAMLLANSEEWRQRRKTMQEEDERKEQTHVKQGNSPLTLPLGTPLFRMARTTG